MSLLSFFARRLLTGAAARAVTNFLIRRFRLSPGIANLIFVVLMEVAARGTEKYRGGAGSGSSRGGSASSGRPNFPKPRR